jgi:hypothetical protein
MAEKRSILRLKGPTQAVALLAAPKFNAHANVAETAESHTPEAEIERGQNPFRVWSRSRLQFAEDMAAAMNIPLAQYASFESGEYTGLTDEHIQSFCRHLKISPVKLVEKKPMTEALRHVLVAQVYGGRTMRARESALFALRNHCDDAEYAITAERRNQEPRGYRKLVVAYMDMLIAKPFHELSEMVPPEDILADMITCNKEQLAHIESLTKIPEPDPLARQFVDPALLLYGQKTGEIWKAIQTWEKGFPWKTLCRMVSENHELLAPSVWHDGGQFVNGVFMHPEKAAAQMMDAYRHLNERHKRKNLAIEEAAVLKKQLRQLTDWGASPMGRRIMKYWHNRHEIMVALNEARPITATQALLLPPVPGAPKPSTPTP